MTTPGTVEKALFSITCTTCRARLAVRALEAVGEIHECPRCGSMVEVVPPEGWQPEAELPQEAAGLEPAAGEAAEGPGPASGAAVAG